MKIPAGEAVVTREYANEVGVQTAVSEALEAMGIQARSILNAWGEGAAIKLHFSLVLEKPAGPGMGKG